MWIKHGMPMQTYVIISDRIPLFTIQRGASIIKNNWNFKIHITKLIIEDMFWKEHRNATDKKFYKNSSFKKKKVKKEWNSKSTKLI